MRAQAGDLAGLTDERTIAQLAGIRYSHNPRGQVVIESKDDARKRGVKSPDRAEAVMLAFAESRSSEFGFIEYLKQEHARMQKAGSASSLACPKCESPAVARIPNGRRCSQCGHQFGYTLNIQRSVNRGEVLTAADALGLFGRRR